MAHLTALDDAAWDCPWRHRRCADKVLLCLALVFTALLLPAWPASPLIMVASIFIIVVWAKIPARVLLLAMAAPSLFIIIGALTIALQLGQTPADALWHYHCLYVSCSSLTQAMNVLGHGFAGTLAIMVFATTTPLVDLLTWLRALHVPAALLEIAALTYRLIFVSLATLISVHEAQTNRLGFERGPGIAGWKRTFQATGTTIGMTLTRSWHRAMRLEEGLSLRGDMDQLMTTARPHRASPAILCASALLPALITVITLGVNI